MKFRLTPQKTLINRIPLFLLIILTTGFLGSCLFESDSPSKEKKTDIETGTITGTIKDKEGKALAGVVVTADGEQFAGLSDSNGIYTLDDIPEGTYKVHFNRAGYGTIEPITVTVTKGKTTTIEEEIKLEPFLVTLKGKVILKGSAKRGADANGVEGVGIKVPYQSAFTVTDSKGEFTLTGVSADVDQIIAALSGAGWGKHTITVQPGETQDGIIIILDREGGAIVGTVKDNNGNPVKNIKVEAIGGGISATTDENGTYRLENVPSNVPVDVKSGNDGGASGLIVDENSQLDGIELFPASTIEKSGVRMENAVYIVPDSGKVVITANVTTSKEAGDVALYLWDTDDDKKYDTVTFSSNLTISGSAKNQKVSFGVLTTGGDSIGGAQVEIQREPSQPKVVLGQGFVIVPREKALLLGEAVCKAGGIISYQWDFNGDGIYDWIRRDVGKVKYRYYQEGTYLAKFLVTASSGEKDSGTIEIKVEGNPIDIPDDELSVPKILSPKHGAEVGTQFLLVWQKIYADSFDVFLDTLTPPVKAYTTGLSDSSLIIKGLTPETRYFVQVKAHLDEETSVSFSVEINAIDNHPPVFDNTAFKPADGDTVYGDSVTLGWLATDADNHPVEYRLSFWEQDSIQQHFTLSATGMNIAPEGGWKDSTVYHWQVTAKDGIDSTATDIRSFLYQIPNNAPVFKVSIKDMEASIMNDGIYLDTLRAQDPDGNTFTYSFIDSVKGMKLTDSILSWTPGINDTGTHTITILLTDTRGGTATLSWTVFVGPSNDASLDTLYLSEGSLTPDFDPAKTTYAVLIPNETTNIKAVASPTHPHAQIKVNGELVAADSMSQTLALLVGSNIITIEVTAEDDSTKKIYKITVTRPPNEDASLSALSLSQGELSPTFSSGNTAYSVTVPNEVSSITLTATASNNQASLTVNDSIEPSGQASAPQALMVGANTITVVVIAEDDTSKGEYTVIVTREPSADASLSALVPSLDSLRFHPDTLSYKINLIYKDSLVKLTPYANHPEAVISIEGTTAASGVQSPEYPLVVGDNQLRVTVTAEDDSTTKIYTVTFIRESGTNVALLGLLPSNGTLSPTFDSASTSYQVSVTHAESLVTLTPTVFHSKSLITISGDTVASDTASKQILLATGPNTVPVLVTAENRTTTRTYTVNFVRDSSTNTDLFALSSSKGSLTPGFGPSEITYNVSLSNEDSVVTITPTVDHSRATVTVEGQSVTSGNPSQPITLAVGDSVIDIEVTAEDMQSTKNYQITFTRAPSSNANLLSLVVNDSILSPAFDSAIVLYIDSLNWWDSVIAITPTVHHPMAAITVNDSLVVSGTASDSIILPLGDSIINIVVTAEDNSTEKTYQLTMRRYNLAPKITGKPDTTIDYVDAAFPTISLNALVDDPDHADGLLTWSVDTIFSIFNGDIAPYEYYPNTEDINSGTNEFSVILYASDWYGADSIFLVATDPFGASDTVKFVWGRATWKRSTLGSTTLQSVHFPVKDTGYIAGQTGSAWRTIDHGKIWEAMTGNMSSDVNTNGIYFYNSTTGITVGDSLGIGNITRITAAGAMMTPPASGMVFDYLKAVHFADQQNGWIGGVPGMSSPITALLRTSDGGANWASANNYTSCGTVVKIFAISYDEAIAGCEEGAVIKTTNGGSVWDTLFNTTNWINDMFFLDQDTGWIVLNNSTDSMYVTRDGGQNWEGIGGIGNNPLGLDRIHFVNSYLGFMVITNQSEASDIYRTEDGGYTWKLIDNENNVKGIFSFSKFDVMTLDGNYVYRYGIFGNLFRSNYPQ
ncbi:MAG: cadherin-like beta sandwich domain-containing protein [Fibrobacteria bacterium]|nr:cadherin-like beta sandwich domain-containing protein [Fibrobacteria bacterium]